MVLNAAVQMLKEADDLKHNILKFKSGTSMLQDRNLWATQQQLQKVYQKVLVLDLDYALDKKVEQDLWNIGFKQQIEALQSISKDRKNPARSEGQAMLSWVLQAAAGFYLGLLHQICTTFKLDLPFRRRASLLGSIEGWGVSEGAAPLVSGARQPPPAAARYIAQHCLVHLGDLARYRHQLRVAHTFYRHAVVVSAHSGQPYNQLALVAWRRGRRLAAVYWHVRSLLVRAPFPPAPANLARTLAAAAAATSDTRELPVLPGLSPGSQRVAPAPARPLDASTYIALLMRALHHIHTLHDLDSATQFVNTLNSSLTALVATDSFEPNTLIKMACVIIWLVHWSTEDWRVAPSALSAGEARSAELSASLAGGALLSLLLPAYTRPKPPHQALPALKVCLHWIVSHRQVLATSALTSRPQLWPALANTLNQLAATNPGFRGDLYETLPLPEDDELVGFLPLEPALEGLKFAEHATWDTYGDRIPDFVDETHSDDAPDNNSDGDSSPSEMTQIALMNEPELESKVRAYRLIQLGKKLTEMCPDMLTLTVEGDKLTFAAASYGGGQLSAALAELSVDAASCRPDEQADPESEDDTPPAPPAPTVISEADFREKVREKRVGILKPQGSLERAREERAGATAAQNDQESESVEEGSKSEEGAKEATRKTRMNVAMAAIMRKQEETNKQVKFVTPPPTLDAVPEIADASTSSTKDAEKTKMTQPKAVKSLANLPIGVKTGGILSLKDKSAGYPHLVNTDPEPVKKPEKDEKKEVKSSQLSQNSQQNYNKKQDHSPSPNWGSNAPQQNYGENPRFNLHKNTYGIQNTGLNYNPNYQMPHSVNNQGIRLPVVNPKEIDVRSAALQKQNSRLEPYQDNHKFGNQSYQNISGDKKNFMNDLPPRFANQYRHWQSSQDNQFSSQDNKFRDQNFQPNNTLFGNNQQQPPPRPGNWMMNPPLPENFHPSVPWWKPENPPPTNFNANFAAPSLNMPPNYFAPQNLPNPYQQNLPSYQPMNQQLGQHKQENIPNSYPIGQPMQGLPNLQSFNSSYGSYTPSVGYDSNMYPQFNKMGFPQSPMTDKPLGQYNPGKELMDMGGLGFGGSVRRNMPSMNFNEPMHSDVGSAKSMDQIGAADKGSNEAQGNTYSLFSGAPETGAWGATQAQPQQSLWSGPGPSPLERLLEQQKQLKHPPEPQ